MRNALLLLLACSIGCDSGVVATTDGSHADAGHPRADGGPPRDGGPRPDGGPVSMNGPLRVSTVNPRYFTDDSGRAIYLVGSHNWANMIDMTQTRPAPASVDFPAYVDFLRSHGHNFFRLWNEILPKICNWGGGTGPYYVSPLPWMRTGPGMATDGLPRFDLDQFDPAYFDRLRADVMAARDAGMYAAVQLFQSYSIQYNRCDDDGYPLTGANNVNGIDDGYTGGASGTESNTLDDAAIVAVEDAYVRHVIDTVNDLDNVLYEIANEAGAYSTDWQLHMIDLIHAYEATLPHQHPVGMTYQYEGGSDDTLFASPAEWISPSGADGYGWPSSPGPATGDKVVVNDTDHTCYYTCLQGAGTDGQRQWSWQNFMAGNNLLFMDPYLITWPGRNDPAGGQPDPAWDPMRDFMGQTRRYADRVGLIDMTPRPDLCSTNYCLVHEGVEYLAYQPGNGAFTVTLTAGTYDVEWFDPVADAVSTPAPITSAGAAESFTAPFDNDAVLYLHAQ